MGATLNNLSVFQYQNHIGVSYGAEPVSHGNYGFQRKNIGNGLLNVLFGYGINHAGCFVQDYQFAVSGNGPRKGDQLGLTFRQVIAIILNHKPVPAGQLVDKTAGINKRSGLLHILFAGR